MKDRTNKEKPHLGQTIECIGMMYRSLNDLYANEYTKSPAWFAVMAQSEIRQIRDLLDDIEWLMEDMIPQKLREDAEKSQEAEDAEAFALEEAA